MRKLLVIFTLCFSIFVVSCGGGGGSGESTKGYPDLGDFKVGTVESNSFTSDYLTNLRQAYQKTADELNSYFKLNRDIFLSFKDCGQENAYYDPQKSEIVLCSELVQNIWDFFYNTNLERYTGDVIVFILGHELGHALIDNLDLPVVGKEEDAVDAMSVVLMLETSDNDEERLESAIGIVLAGYYLNNISSTTPFYDEHSIGPVRLANLVCWAGGGEPQILDIPDIRDLFYQMVDSGRDCFSEYRQQRDNTLKLLSPYLKRPL